ncbi:MAG: TIM barrel protein [Candidatus Micrarchaeota archaeon]
MGMIFGTAGIPLRLKERDTVLGIKDVSDLGLQALEMEFVHGVSMKEEKAREVGKAAEKSKVSLSIHAPYYINLLSEEKPKRDASRKRIIDSCRIGSIAGARRIVVHPAFYGKLEKRQALEEMRVQIAMVLEEMERSKIANTAIALETMGKRAQFGTIEENFGIANEFGIGKVNPCIDFGHLHARGNGCLKRKQDFSDVLEKVGSFGKEYLQALHIHFEGIAFTEKGERNHLPISSKSPDFELLAGALIEKNCSGTIICESPEIENDALEMQRIYMEKISLRGG